MRTLSLPVGGGQFSTEGRATEKQKKHTLSPPKPPAPPRSPPPGPPRALAPSHHALRLSRGSKGDAAPTADHKNRRARARARIACPLRARERAPPSFRPTLHAPRALLADARSLTDGERERERTTPVPAVFSVGPFARARDPPPRTPGGVSPFPRLLRAR